MKIRVWDLPTRLFHWIWATAFAVAWLTAEEDQFLDVHVYAGYLMLGLLVLRVIWGFAGSRYARFDAFWFSGREVMTYLRGLMARRAPRYLGHNPAGAWAIYLLFALGLLVTVTGIASLGGEEQHGAARGVTTFAGGGAIKELHEGLAIAMLLLVIFHIVGIIVESRAHHENLARAMVSGYKDGAPQQSITSNHYAAGAVLVLLIGGFTVWFFGGYATATAARPYLPFMGKTLPHNKLWREECGACHLAFHPTLLPARSWALLMQQRDHFGDNLDLDPAVAAEISDFLQRYSADAGLTEAGYKIRQSIPPDATPLRITETGYWIAKHEEIPDAVWNDPKVGSKSNCAACHLDAETGNFEDAAMRLPEGVNRR